MNANGSPGGLNKTNVVLAVSGSIAAFKAAALASLLTQNGHNVRVILTEGGARFVTPLTFEAVTGHPVASSLWDESPGTSRMGHIDLARWADILVVAPASASAIARLALGLPTDLLGAVALSTQSPTLVAPAMESGMWAHPATQHHIDTLQRRGVTVVGPESGRLASGAQGAGRMVEPSELLSAIRSVLGRSGSLAGRHVLVTAGPTYEPIDPVRFIGNRSSGKMGYAMAEEAYARGASVTLISGPTALPPPPGVCTVPVETAAAMRDAVIAAAPNVDIAIMAAAVADFKPTQLAPSKLRRSGGLTLELSPTDDIAAQFSQLAPYAYHVGFALETADLIAAAREKLRKKGQRLVVGNLVTADRSPFGSDSNTVVLVTDSSVTELPELSKRELAAVIFDAIESDRAKRGSRQSTTTEEQLASG